MMKLITSMGILMFFSNPYLLVLGISSIVILLITSLKHDEIYLYPSSILVWDNLAMIMILLTLWVTLLMLLTNMSSTQKFMSQTMSPKNYLSMKSNSITVIIFLMISLIFTFSMNSIIQFYIMFEITLIPTFILIMGWGSQPERLQAGLYLLLYTVFFSLPLLVSILFLSYINSTDLMLMLNPLNYSFKTSIWTFLFTLAFLVKLPIYSLHLWLPKAHVEAPVEGSMILAGVLLKLGGYGLIRIIPILKTSISPLKHIYISWAILGGLYAGIMCLAQMDIKLLIALSSVAHMSLVASGLMSLNKWGLTGSVLLMVAHGLSSSAMFCLNNMIYERMHSRSLLLLKGLSTLIPFFALSWFITVMANMAVPPSMNLVSEIMLLISIQSTSYFYLLPLASSIFISALYSLFLYSFTSHGKTLNSMFTFENLSLRESLISLLHLIPTFIPIFSLKIMLLYL